MSLYVSRFFCLSLSLSLSTLWFPKGGLVFAEKFWVVLAKWKGETERRTDRKQELCLCVEEEEEVPCGWVAAKQQGQEEEQEDCSGWTDNVVDWTRLCWHFQHCPFSSSCKADGVMEQEQCKIWEVTMMISCKFRLSRIDFTSPSVHTLLPALTLHDSVILDPLELGHTGFLWFGLILESESYLTSFKWCMEKCPAVCHVDASSLSMRANERMLCIFEQSFCSVHEVGKSSWKSLQNSWQELEHMELLRITVWWGECRWGMGEKQADAANGIDEDGVSQMPCNGDRR